MNVKTVKTKDDRERPICLCTYDGNLTIYRTGRKIVSFQIGPMFVRELKEALDANILPLTEEAEIERRMI